MNKNLISSLVAIFVIATYSNATIYEDGTNIDKWGKLDALPATVSTVYDTNKNSNVIEFKGKGFDSAYIYGYKSSEWKNSTEKILKWSMNYSEDYAVYVRLMTTKGFRFLEFTPNGIAGKKEVYIQHILGNDTKNGTWQSFEIDLEAYLKKYEPNNSIVEVNGIIFRGSGRVDDIELTNTSSGGLVVNAGDDKNITLGDTITLNGTGTDSNGTIVSYEWKEGSNILSNSASFDYIPTKIGTHTLTLYITDNNGVVGSDTVNILVKQNIDSNDTSATTQEVSLCQNNSAYISTLYNLGMTINSSTAHGTVLSKGDNFVGAVFCGTFTSAKSSEDVLNSIKQVAFPSAKNIILNNNSDGSIKAQYEVNGLNKQAYAELKTILEAIGENDFSNYIDYSSISSIKDIYIDIYIKYVNPTTTYVIVTVTDKNDNNVKRLNHLVNGKIISYSNNQNITTETFTYSSNRLKADILFVMDDSGSMSEEQTAAANAVVRTFGLAMSAKNVDWKATVVGTEYSRNYLNRYINNPSENDITKLSSQLKLGTYGWDERGILKAYKYLTDGSITVRSGSSLAIVYISDEICHTNLSDLGVSNIANSYFVKNNIKVNAIIPLTGEYEGGYVKRVDDLSYKMANATGGEVANLHNYATGYDTMMQKIADNSAGSASLIVLSHQPIISSIKVSVNGTVVSGWSYNSLSNSIVFDKSSLPNSGDSINVTYSY